MPISSVKATPVSTGPNIETFENGGIHIPTSALKTFNDAGTDLVGLKANSDGHLRVASSAATTGAQDRMTVDVPGTPEQLSSGAVGSVTVIALPSNTERVALGFSNAVRASDALLNGVPLEPGQSVSIAIDNTNKIYIDAIIAGEGVSWVSLV